MRVLFIVLLLLLAGCASSPAPPAAVEAEEGPGVPVWEVGQWWNYTLSDGRASTRVVVSADGADYVVSASDAGSAFFDARLDISTMGPQRKSDLAGSQGAVRVEYLKWPLTDGDSWTTTWDGEVVTITAEAASDGRFSFESRNATGGLHARYSFDPDVGWFDRLEFHGEAEPFVLALQDHGEGYNGTIAAYALEEAVSWDGDLSGASQSATFEVSAAVTDVYALWRFDCTAGAYIVSAGQFGPAHPLTGMTQDGICPETYVVDGVLGLHSADETWGAMLQAGPTTTGTYEMTIWLRTLTRTAFP